MTACGDFSGFRTVCRQRLAALRHAGQQQHVVTKRHAAQPSGKHTAGRALSIDIAIAAHRKLHALAAAGGKATKQVAGASAGA
jgi:hypothetical protein